MQRSLLALFAVALLALLLAAPARAHANLLRSDPPAGCRATVRAARDCVLEFTEDLDPSFSRVQLLDSKGQIIDAGPGVIDAAQPLVMRLALGDLPNDSYTALWRVRAAVDGHVTEGSLPFGVGVAASTASLIPALGTPDPATETPPPLDSAARWLNFLCLAVAFGGLPFALLVWRPAIRAALRGGLDVAAADATMTLALRRVLLVGGALFLLANGLFLLTQAAAAAGVPLGQALGAPAAQLLGTRSGQLILARAGFTLLVMAIAWRLPQAGRGPAWPWWAALLLGAGAILAISLNGHGAAEPQGAALAVALDWLHIAAMVAWLGGLVPLLIAVRAARRAPEQALPLAILIPRFSRLAMPCVVLADLDRELRLPPAYQPARPARRDHLWARAADQAGHLWPAAAARGAQPRRSIATSACRR